MAPTPLLSPADFPISADVDVRFRDLDALGHVNNAVFASYFEMGRVAYIRAMGVSPAGPVPMPDLFPFVLAELNLQFLSPVLLGERVRVHVRCPRVGGKSFDFEYLATEAASGRVVAAGRSVQVAWDFKAGRTQPVPDAVREAIARVEATRRAT